MARFDGGNAQWCPARPDLPELDRWLAGDDATAVLVKANSKRSVYALSPAVGEPPSCFLKYDHPVGFRDRMKGLVRSKVEWEYRDTACLHQAGVPVAAPIAAGWCGIEGILLTRAVPAAVAADQLWHEVEGHPDRRRNYLQALHRLLAALLDKKVRHPDLHLGNVLATEAGGRTRFVLVDVYGSRLGNDLDHTQQTAILLLASPLRCRLTAAERQDLLRGLPGIDDAEIESCWNDIARANVREFYRRWTGRRKKLLCGSGASERRLTAAGKWICRDDADRESLAQAVAIHRQQRDETPDQLLKNSRKRCVSRVAIDGAEFAVKEFRHPGRWGRLSADARSWLNNWGLAMAGFRVPRCHGWLQAADGASYLVSDFVPGDELFTALQSGQGGEALFAKVYDYVRELCRWRVHHEDLKITNFILHAGELWLVDNDAVVFDRHIGPKEWQRNRRQLLRGRDDYDFLAAFADWFDAQPPPYRGV